MNKTQEKAMQIIVNNAPNHLKDSIGHIHFTGDYAYSTDGYQIYRIPCTEYVTVSFKNIYPKNKLDSFLQTDDSWNKYFLNTDIVADDGYFKLVRIGHCFYDIKKVRKAIQILGKKAIAYQNPEKTFTGIVIESDKGIGYIMPVIYSC